MYFLRRCARDAIEHWLVEPKSVRGERPEDTAAEALEDLEQPAILERLSAAEGDRAHRRAHTVLEKRNDIVGRPARAPSGRALAVTERACLRADARELQRQSFEAHAHGGNT